MFKMYYLRGKTLWKLRLNWVNNDHEPLHSNHFIRASDTSALNRPMAVLRPLTSPSHQLWWCRQSLFFFSALTEVNFHCFPRPLVPKSKRVAHEGNKMILWSIMFIKWIRWCSNHKNESILIFNGLQHIARSGLRAISVCNISITLGVVAGLESASQHRASPECDPVLAYLTPNSESDKDSLEGSAYLHHLSGSERGWKMLSSPRPVENSE